MSETGLCCLVARAAAPAEALASARVLYARTDAASGERLLIAATSPGRLHSADENDFAAIEITAGEVRVSGDFKPRVFELALEVRIGLLITPALIPQLEAFLADNPFMAFAAVSRREAAGPHVLYTTVLDLSSTACRDVRHELPAFALRNGPEAQAQTYVETFNEDGQMLTFGDLPVARGSIGRAAARVRDTQSGWTLRADASGLLSPIP